MNARTLSFRHWLCLLAACSLAWPAVGQQDFGFEPEDDHAVTVYSDVRFRGRAESFTSSDRRLDDNRIGNDGPVSVRVPDGCTVTLYEHFDFVGRSIRLDTDVADLGRTRFGAREASSLEVECRGGFDNPRDEDRDLDGDGDRDRDEDRDAGGDRQLGDRQGALLFAETEFRGRFQFLRDSVADLSRLRIGDDSVSSLRVARGCRLTLFTEPDFAGESEVFTGGSRGSLRGSAIGPDTASSLHVDCAKGRDGRPAVTVYADSQYRGARVRFDDDVRQLAESRLGDDRLGSLRIDEGCRVTVFDEADFRGRSVRLDRDTPSLVGTAVGPDSASSLRVECRGGGSGSGVEIEVLPRGYGALLYDHSRFEGPSARIQGDTPRLSATAIGNDRASSIRIAPGCEALLFSDADFRGRSIRLTTSVDDLDRTPVGSNALSSIRVRCR